MRYLIIGQNPTTNAIEWNVLDSREKIPNFIKSNYGKLIQRCNFSWGEVRRYILIFEIEPTYDILALNITKPVDFKIELSRL